MRICWATRSCCLEQYFQLSSVNTARAVRKFNAQSFRTATQSNILRLKKGLSTLINARYWLIFQVSETLNHAVETHLAEVHEDQVRWLFAANEKVAWCEDMDGDKYSIEAKFAAIKVRWFSQQCMEVSFCLLSY